VLQSVLAELEREKRLAQVTLEPLSRENTLSLTRVLMAPVARAGVARLGEHVWQLSEGNPFVVREAVRAFQENPQSSITGSAPTPELVGRMVLERLERLGNVARALCAAAAVLGKAVRLALLRRTAGVDEREAVDGVEELVRSGVLRVVGEEVGFTHDWIREVGYTSLKLERRRLLHVEAAVAIEQLYADDLEPHLAALAEHWREAEEWDKAVHYRRRAADQALTRAAYVEAGRLLEETLDLVAHLPEASGRSDVELDVLLRLRVLTKLVGEGEHLGRHLDEAERLARVLGDARRLAFVLSERSHIAWLRGDQVRATEFGQQVEALGQQLGDRPIEGFGHRLVGKSYLGLGLCEVAAEHLTRAVELLPDDGQPDFGLGDARSGTQIWLAIALTIVGRFDEATRILDEVMAVAAGQNNHRQLAWATTFAAMVRVERGEVAEAFGLLERAGHLISTWQIAAVAPWRAQVLGRACALAGRQAEALRIFDRFEPRPQLFGSWIALLKGDAYLAAELLDDALAMARTALDIARRLGERGSEAPALRLLGDAHARLGAPDDETAAAHFREGIAVSEETGNRPQMARCHLGLGLLLRRAGRHDEAFLHLAAARRMLSEMGMTYWLARIPDGVA
jgi:tetratricopeptide (TPR) repeat protein